MPEGQVTEIRDGFAAVLYSGRTFFIRKEKFARPMDCGELTEENHGRLRVGSTVLFTPNPSTGFPEKVLLKLPPVPLFTQDPVPTPMTLVPVQALVSTGMEQPTPEPREEKTEALPLPDPCCKAVGRVLEILLASDLASQPLAVIIRQTFELLCKQQKPLARSAKRTAVQALAFDISFLWDAKALETCPAKAAVAIESLQALQEKWKQRPDTHDVASCHPTAEDLMGLLGTRPFPLEKHGWLGLTQSSETGMAVHQENAQRLCTSLFTNDRGLWWVTHCGHSFSLLKRSREAPIEVIDSFAHDRGLGLWALSPEEIEEVGRPGDDGYHEGFDVHVPPRQRYWQLEELQLLLRRMVDDNQETRWAAQLALVNYMFEMPEEKGPNDRLPHGPFGYERANLVSDRDIVIKMATRLAHAFARAKLLIKSL